MFLTDRAHKMYVLLTWNLDAWMFGMESKLTLALIVHHRHALIITIAMILL